MVPRIFGQRFGAAPRRLGPGAKVTGPLCWLAVICLLISTYTSALEALPQSPVLQDHADARHEGDSSHSLANCDGGVVCSALLVPMAEGSFRYLFRVQETPASVPHVPDLLSPVIDPPPPKLSA